MGDVPECFKNGLPRTTYEGPPNLTPPEPDAVPEYTAKEFFAHLRPSVRAFALKKDCTIDCLRALLDGETREFDDALRGESEQAIAYEGADVANYLLMLCDITGGLTSDHTIIGARRS